MLSSSIIRLLSLLTAILLSSASFAKQFELGDNQTLDVSGYLGWMQVNSTGGSVRDTFPSQPEMGVIFNYKYSAELNWFGQFKYGSHHDDVTIDDVMVYNFAAWSHHLAEHTDLTLRGGRLRTTMGLYSTTRVNPRTRQGVIMPQGIYYNTVSETLTSGDGIELEVKHKDATLTFSVLDPIIRDPIESALIFSGPVLRRTKTSLGSLLTATARYEPSTFPIKAQLSWSRLNTGNDTFPRQAIPDFPHAQFSPFAGKDIINEFLVASIEYRPLPDITLSAEVLPYRLFTQSWIKDLNNLAYGTSFTVQYAVHENVTLYANYTSYEANVLKRIIKDIQDDPFAGYARDFNFGANFHTGNWMLGMEAHHVEGHNWISERDDTPSEEPYWMTAMNIVYFFN